MTTPEPSSAKSSCCDAKIFYGGPLGDAMCDKCKQYCAKAPDEVEIEKLIVGIERDVFDCCDALQNAYGTLKYRSGVFGAEEALEKAEEYLREWPPEWMREDTFTIAQVPEKIGTDKVRQYIRSLRSCLSQKEEECTRYKEALHKIECSDFMDDDGWRKETKEAKIAREALSPQ